MNDVPRIPPRMVEDSRQRKLFKGERGPDGLPLRYDIKWQMYTDLSPADKDWFRSQREWLVKYACVAHWHREIHIIDSELKMPCTDGTHDSIPDATKDFPAIMKKIDAIRKSLAAHVADAKAGKFKSTDEIDASMSDLPKGP